MNIKSAVRFMLPGVFCFLFASPALSGYVFVTGAETIGTYDHLYAFTDDGTFIGATQGPGTNLYTHITAHDKYVYVADGSENMIEQFNLSGSYVGDFADVGADLLGWLAGNVECDSRENLYAHHQGYRYEPRNAGRYDLASGALTGTFAHPDLVFPRGIDADGMGNVYIVNSARVGVGNRVFKFSPDGALLGTFDPEFIENPSDLAIDEANEVLYMIDEGCGTDAVHAYSLAEGTFGLHIKTISVPGADYVIGLHYEPSLEHLFVASCSEPHMTGGEAIEIDTDGNVICTYQPPGVILVRDVVYVPEPATLSLLALGGVALIRRRRKK